MKVKTQLCGLGLILVSGYCLYEFGLSDDAKAKLKSAVNLVLESSKKIASVLEDIQGQVVEDEGPLYNVESTKAQWKAMGY